MTRNIRNELLTAILVLGGIILAVIGVIALSAPSPNADITSQTPTTVSMVESPVTKTIIPTTTALQLTSQSVHVTATPRTNITPTLSALQSSALATLTAFAAIPTRTATTSPTPTNTFIIPTPTPRITNTPLPLPTDTLAPPTATSRPTNTPTLPLPTPTTLSTNTNTPIPPTNTKIPATQTYTPTITLTNTPDMTHTPTPTSLPPIYLSAEGCLNPSVQITFPQPNQQLTESFEIIGTATLPNFGLYRIEIRPDSALTYQRIVASQQVIYADVLAEIDPTQYPAGIYWIRLVVVDNRGNIAENGTCVIPTIFE